MYLKQESVFIFNTDSHLKTNRLISFARYFSFSFICIEVSLMWKILWLCILNFFVFL